MATILVQFTYVTGFKREIFSNVRLTGSWDNFGRHSEEWTTTPMQLTTCEDGCPCFTASVAFDDLQIGRQFHWGVILDTSMGKDIWGITTEIKDSNSSECYRVFSLQAPSNTQPQQEKYYLTHSRRLGAQKYYFPGQSQPGIQFAVWAPNAKTVEVIFGTQTSGYIADDASGIDPAERPIPMFLKEEGIWKTDIAISPQLADFSNFDHKPYMFRIAKEGGKIAYRTDLYSRCQIGKGNIDPKGQPYSGSYTELDGTKSCSVVVDPDTVSKNFKENVWPEKEFIPEQEFWKDEFQTGRIVPKRVEDLVIYELHIGALGYGKNINTPGNFEDAINLLDYLVDLGVNAVELLPMSQFRRAVNWGYETSHYFALEYSAGGRDQLKFFVKECHRRGLAVILDVVYNHYTPDAERDEFAYDSDVPENNIYYWYEGKASDYRQSDGGYVDNGSTGFSPRFHEEMVRKMFISSAATLLEEFHIDGLRVDLTTAMHRDNVLHADGRSLSNVNLFGIKFLREWTSTMKLIRSDVMLIAEDHSEWEKVTESPDTGGLGFDATWYAKFYHHLVGPAQFGGGDYAKLIATAGFGTDDLLAMDSFAGALSQSGHKKVVYHESHDEAGNSQNSARTIVLAANSAPLIGETRRYAEARCHFAFGMAILSAGTPMFLMGEEIGAQKPYRYGDFIQYREDLLGERQTNGRRLFQFYQDIIRLRLNHSGLRSHSIKIIYVHNINRVIAFRRWDATEEFLVVASLNNHPFPSGYTIENSPLSDGPWREIFNSDAQIYGGESVGNLEATISSGSGRIHVVVPANGFVVLQKTAV